jgi:hypothetical protein
MKEHEKEHYEYFDNEIKKRNIKLQNFYLCGINGCYSWFWNCNAW